MATAVDSSPPSPRSPHYLQLDSLPIVDLNALSQSELNSLSLCSSDAGAFDFRHCDDLVVPKIDRTVFNESKGGRKQTYSRLRLAPRQPDLASPSRKTNKKTAIEETSGEIASVLRRLLGRGGGGLAAIEGSDCGAAAAKGRKKRGRPRKDQGSVRVRVLEECGGLDPFGEELRKMTVGLETAAEFLGFLGGFEGEWANQRKKRKIVDAGEFGDYLPKGWKVLLSLKRRRGCVSLCCRRYISTNGQQFASWNEVSSYLMSLGPLNSYTVNHCSSDETSRLPSKTTYENVSTLAPKNGHARNDFEHSTKSPVHSTLLNPQALIDVEVLSVEASESQLNDAKVMNHDPRCSVANTIPKPDMDFARTTDGRNGEKDVLRNVVVGTSSAKKRWSSDACSIDMAKEKGRNNLSNLDKNNGSMVTAEEPNLDNNGARHTSGMPSSVSYREELTPMNLTEDLPKIADTKQLCSVCIWCGVEFKHEAVKPEARFSDPVGFLCSVCRDKLSVLDNGFGNKS
ncbi:hypothetical protein Scep_018525 [Stephania cephalantha]|uniref:MBD domain-containing protein n=1 Tax=Stephania cephalantha TaxID=152367 RepID=A0AAP0I940_9MAGN